jgi:hypothetical protein
MRWAQSIDLLKERIGMTASADRAKIDVPNRARVWTGDAAPALAERRGLVH